MTAGVDLGSAGKTSAAAGASVTGGLGRGPAGGRVLVIDGRIGGGGGGEDDAHVRVGRDEPLAARVVGAGCVGETSSASPALSGPSARWAVP